MSKFLKELQEETDALISGLTEEKEEPSFDLLVDESISVHLPSGNKRSKWLKFDSLNAKPSSKQQQQKHRANKSSKKESAKSEAENEVIKLMFDKKQVLERVNLVNKLKHPAYPHPVKRTDGDFTLKPQKPIQSKISPGLSVPFIVERVFSNQRNTQLIISWDSKRTVTIDVVSEIGQEEQLESSDEFPALDETTVVNQEEQSHDDQITIPEVVHIDEHNTKPLSEESDIQTVALEADQEIIAVACEPETSQVPQKTPFQNLLAGETTITLDGYENYALSAALLLRNVYHESVNFVAECPACIMLSPSQGVVKPGESVKVNLRVEKATALKDNLVLNYQLENTDEIKRQVVQVEVKAKQIHVDFECPGRVEGYKGLDSHVQVHISNKNNVDLSLLVNVECSKELIEFDMPSEVEVAANTVVSVLACVHFKQAFEAATVGISLKNTVTSEIIKQHILEIKSVGLSCDIAFSKECEETYISNYTTGTLRETKRHVNQLDFGKCRILAAYKTVLTIRNTSPVPAKLSLSLDKYKASSGPDVDSVTLESRKLGFVSHAGNSLLTSKELKWPFLKSLLSKLADQKGFAIDVKMPSSYLEAYTETSIEITVCANSWGVFEDLCRIQIGDLTFEFKITGCFEGSPLIFSSEHMNLENGILFAPVMSKGLKRPEKLFRLWNMSPHKLQVMWTIYQIRHFSETRPIRFELDTKLLGETGKVFGRYGDGNQYLTTNEPFSINTAISVVEPGQFASVRIGFGGKEEGHVKGILHGRIALVQERKLVVSKAKNSTEFSTGSFDFSFTPVEFNLEGRLIRPRLEVDAVTTDDMKLGSKRLICIKNPTDIDLLVNIKHHESVNVSPVSFTVPPEGETMVLITKLFDTHDASSLPFVLHFENGEHQ